MFDGPLGVAVKTLTKQEAQQWCQQRGIPQDDQRRPVRPVGVAEFKIPVDAGQRVALVSNQFEALREAPEILVWCTSWGVWPSGERPHIFQRLRASYGETRGLSEVPAQTFDGSEYDDALSFVVLGVLFLWDIMVVGGVGQSILSYSHDEFGWLGVSGRRTSA